MGCEYCDNKKHIKQIDFNGNIYQHEQDLSESGVCANLNLGQLAH